MRNSIWELDDRTDEPKEQRLETMVFQDKDSKFLKESLDIDFDNTDCKLSKKDNHYKKNICFFYTELKKLSNNTLNKFVDFLLCDYIIALIPYFKHCHLNLTHFKANMITRTLYAGEHLLEVQINGTIVDSKKFELKE